MQLGILQACGSALLVWGALGASVSQPDNRPFELTIYRHPRSLGCSYATLRQTQIYRGILDDGHTESLVTHSGDERLRFISHDLEGLRLRARSLCHIPDANAGDQKEKVLAVTAGDSHAHLTLPDTLRNLAALEYPPLQVEPLITSGSSENRVDLVFFADGYVREEKAKFLKDAMRLATDISGNQTFDTVKPLLNFWAAFTPSNESGIGVGGKPKDTPFGLYRDGTELRGVYYDKPDAARAACYSLGDRCDYPILMGNDPLYGGLGGEFTVITPSLDNGALVLRHELGHSVIDVGEEYDGGYAYFGVNAAHNLSIPWAHWLSNSSEIKSGADIRVERSAMPMQKYAWTMLNTSVPWSVSFNSSGTYPRHLVRFSLSGLPDEDDLSVVLDGERLPWTPKPGIGVDRWHYDIHRSISMTEGEHRLSFTLENGDKEGLAQLCSAEILEFGDETEFNGSPGHYSIFPTFSEQNETSYRPTNEDCLMRQVTTPNFCRVCVEGLWLSLLRRVDLIDGIRSRCDWELDMGFSDEDPPIGKWKRTLDLDLIPLAQFRAERRAPHESYTVTWAKDGQILERFTNKTQLKVDDQDGPGVYSVSVQFTTSEVRVDRDGLLESERSHTVSGTCSGGQ
ncbi:hypothetical protein CERSUDRAFT_111969 [Gelatoporia subvermispora B]|uniref:IgA peptidase M64-domain-containing protein n=1 Tax=Ceriporiopsis subvermispora (strain B) TaxID=914234 RepID=M2QRE9_CERS8|nr:hypothetical protein CERSUDRAFT_111969 [Gelatoporia subvermispora B]